MCAFARLRNMHSPFLHLSRRGEAVLAVFATANLANNAGMRRKLTSCQNLLMRAHRYPPQYADDPAAFQLVHAQDPHRTSFELTVVKWFCSLRLKHSIPLQIALTLSCARALCSPIHPSTTLERASNTLGGCWIEWDIWVGSFTVRRMLAQSRYTLTPPQLATL